MKKALLDASFIISAVDKKIDLFEELQDYEVLIPEEAIKEIYRITLSKQSLKNKNAAKLALKILERSEKIYKKIFLSDGTRKHTDKLIIKYGKEYPEILIATLDKGIKSYFKGRLVIIRGSKIDRA